MGPSALEECAHGKMQRDCQHILHGQHPIVGSVWQAAVPRSTHLWLVLIALMPGCSSMLLPVCDGAGQNDGAWEEVFRTPEDKLPCCGVHEPRWNEQQNQCFRDAHCRTLRLVEEEHRGCTCSSAKSFEWRPRHCRLVEWDSSHFCSVLGERRLLMVGDSTMHQHFVVLHNAIVWGAALLANASSSDCESQLGFEFSDTLDRKSVV